MVPTSSTVRGQSLKLDSTTRWATTGSATNYFISWQRQAATSWDLTCSHVLITAGTTPSTVRSWCCRNRPTTPFVCPGTQVTPVMMPSATTTAWCSPRTTVTMTRGPAVPPTKTAQCLSAADSGTRTAATVEWTVFAVTSTGPICLEAANCSHPACGWSVVRSTIQLQSHRLAS